MIENFIGTKSRAKISKRLKQKFDMLNGTKNICNPIFYKLNSNFMYSAEINIIYTLNILFFWLYERRKKQRKIAS